MIVGVLTTCHTQYTWDRSVYFFYLTLALLMWIKWWAPTNASKQQMGFNSAFKGNCLWTIVTDRHSWNVSTQNAFSLLFAAILVNCASSGQMRNYCTPHIIKENFENFLIHRCNYILLSQVYCVWQVVKTPTIISNNPVLKQHSWRPCAFYCCLALSVLCVGTGARFCMLAK